MVDVEAEGGEATGEELVVGAEGGDERQIMQAKCYTYAIGLVQAHMQLVWLGDNTKLGHRLRT